jgi:RNA polymerase sigma factor (sigma-70 family)
MEMENPFLEDRRPDPSDEALVDLARAGDAAALEQLVRRHQAWVFNVVARMVWRRSDAEDLTQEILVKAVTKLASFEGRSAFRTWLYRIAVNHALESRKQPMERQAMTLPDLALSLGETPELPLPAASDPEQALLVEEAKIGCTMAMLMCLDRRQRLVYILGEILGVSDALGAEIAEVSAANFRQLRSRARRDLHAFMNGECGLVNEAAPCRCARKTAGFIQRGYLDPARPQFTRDRLVQIRTVAPARHDDLDALDRACAEVFRDQALLAPPDVAGRLRQLLADPRFEKIVAPDA